MIVISRDTVALSSTEWDEFKANGVLVKKPCEPRPLYKYGIPLEEQTNPEMINWNWVIDWNKLFKYKKQIQAEN